MPARFDPDKIAFLARRRERIGLTTGDIEDKLGLSERMVTKWEKGIRSPTASNLDRWCEALGYRLVFKRVS